MKEKCCEQGDALAARVVFSTRLAPELALFLRSLHLFFDERSGPAPSSVLHLCTYICTYTDECARRRWSPFIFRTSVVNPPTPPIGESRGFA